MNEMNHPKIQQFVRDIDAVYVKIWDRFHIRTHLPPCETFPNSKFLDLFNRCHRHLTSYLDVYCKNHGVNEILFPTAISLHEFMNGVECKVSLPPTEFHRIRPYRSEEMQPFIAQIVCFHWFRCEYPLFDLQWTKVSWWDRRWYGQSICAWLVTEKGPRIMDIYKLMQYFFGDAFRHKPLKNNQTKWFLQKSKLDECLDLFTPMHVRLPLNPMYQGLLQDYLITDLVKICISYL